MSVAATQGPRRTGGVLDPANLPIGSAFSVDHHIDSQPAPTSPPIQTEIVQMSLAGGAPTGSDTLAPFAMGVQAIDLQPDGVVDTAHQIMHQVSGAATLDDASIVPVTISALQFTPTGTGYDVHIEANTTGSGGLITSIDFLNDLRGYSVQAPPPPCIGDLDGDGSTTVFDFGIFAVNFGAGPGATPEQGDPNRDGFVNVFDFAIFVSGFGCTSRPGALPLIENDAPLHVVWSGAFLCADSHRRPETPASRDRPRHVSTHVLKENPSDRAGSPGSLARCFKGGEHDAPNRRRRRCCSARLRRSVHGAHPW